MLVRAKIDAKQSALLAASEARTTRKATEELGEAPTLHLVLEAR
jgi:hypothetical protein